MKNYRMAFHAFWLLCVLTSAGMAGTLNLTVVELADGRPIPNVTITSTYTMFTTTVVSTFMTDAEGRAVVIHPGLGGSSCMVITVTYTLSKPDYQFDQPTGSAPCGPVNQSLTVRGTTLPQLASVSAASYKRELADEMIVASFGEKLAETTEIATATPLPVTLADRKILIKDSAGTEKTALLLFVSPTQINYIVPKGLASGTGTLRLVDQMENLIRFGFVDLRVAAPSVFSANADGQGVPAAVIVRGRADGTQEYESIAQFDEKQQKYIPRPIDLGPDSDIVVLALFGTGWRNGSNPRVIIFGTDGLIEYSGKQPTLEGLDQLNVRLPRSLIGRGEQTVYVSFDFIEANPVLINIK